MNKCPECGKLFPVLWPHLWVYKRDNKYLCSYGCMRAYDKRYERKDVEIMAEMFGSRLAQLDAIVKEIEEGRDPLVMLKARGYANPGQTYQNTKRWAQDNYPETADLLPVNLKEWKKQLKAPKVEVPEKALQVETPEGEFAVVKAADIVKAVNQKPDFDDRTTVTAIRVEGLGEFYFDKKFNCIDWRTVAGEEISLGPAWWIQLTEDLPMIMKKLGVEI